LLDPRRKAGDQLAQFGHLRLAQAFGWRRAAHASAQRLAAALHGATWVDDHAVGGDHAPALGAAAAQKMSYVI